MREMSTKRTKGAAVSLANRPAMETRGSSKKMGRLVLCVAVLICLVMSAGCSGITGLSSKKAPEPKDFSIEGMTITLTDEFQKVDVEEYTACYATSKIAMYALKEAFSLAEGFGDYTLEQYAEMVRQNNSSFSPSELKETEGLKYFEYDFTNPESKTAYHYVTFLFKGKDAFWLVQFAATKGEDHFESLVDFAKTVNFS